MTGRQPAPIAEYSLDEMKLSPGGMRQKMERAIEYPARWLTKIWDSECSDAVATDPNHTRLISAACEALLARSIIRSARPLHVLANVRRCDAKMSVMLLKRTLGRMSTSVWPSTVARMSPIAHRIPAPEQQTSNEPKKLTSSGRSASGAASYRCTP
mmetsp:Transcript_34313/g.73281  ORF Transcript_34313/g.73281 Transcript_34313/m.73281 type:complete len:156 (-) Transcript_34313:463-930(-)